MKTHKLGLPKPAKKGKKEKKPVKKVSSRGALIEEAHAIMRDIVILRDGKCVCPPPEGGHSAVLQAGHIIPSTKSGVRFDLYNVHCQCASCNLRHRHYEHYYVDWFVANFGFEQKLRIGREADGLLKKYELEELVVQLTAIREKQKQMDSLLWHPYFTQEEILSGSWRKKE